MSNYFLQHCQRLEAWCHGIIGFSAIHLPSMEKVGYNATQHFDLCSTYKIPIAVTLLQQVALGKLNFNTMIEVHDYHLRIGSATSPLGQLNYDSPVHMSILNLLQIMLQDSCNSATDIILDLIGGSPAVMHTLEQAGIKDLRVDRSVLELLAAAEGIQPAPSKACTIAQYQALKHQVVPAVKAEALAQFKQDIRDQGSPEAMCQFLDKIQNHTILEEPHAELMLRIMQRCKAGAGRIMGLLPPQTKVSHKTGTDMDLGEVSDVGMIYLPDSMGQIAIAVYVADTTQPKDRAERVIAEVARTVYDYFLFKMV